MRVVFDTNIIVSALLLSGSKPSQAFRRALSHGKILLSYPVLAEICDVLGREKLRRYVEEEDVRIFLAALTREAEWVDPDLRITACRDPKDNKFLELALSGRATHIVTGDSDLLVLSPFQGVTILSPQQFLESF